MVEADGQQCEMRLVGERALLLGLRDALCPVEEHEAVSLWIVPR